MNNKSLLIPSLVVFILFGLLLAISTTGDVTRQVRAEAQNRVLAAHSSLTATQSTTPTEPFSFVVTADMRQFAGPGQYDTPQYFRGAVEAIGSLGAPAFLISPGDLDPPTNVRWTIDQYLGASSLWFPVVGNHEISPTDYMPYLRAYNYDPNGSAPPNIVHAGPASCPETTFSFDYQNAHFVVLNEYCDTAGDDVTDGDIPDVLYNWLLDDLNATSQPHIFVFGHEPAFPQPDADNGRVRHFEDSLNAHPANRDRFWALLKTKGVAAYICGHTHNYSAVLIDSVWQVDVGHARGLGDTGARSTFVSFHVNGESVTFDTYRDDANGGAYVLAHTGIMAGQSQGKRIETIGQLGGTISALTIRGTLAYINIGPNLFIFDISNPVHPVMVGQTGPILGPIVQDVIVSGDYAYVAEWSGLHIVNIASPSQPFEVGEFAAPWVTDVAAGNGYAYLADLNGVYMLDVSNPASPTQVGYYSTWPVQPATLARSGAYLYVQYGAGDWGETIDIVDVSDPAHPVKVGNVFWSWYSYDLDIVGTYLYSAAARGGLRIFDVSNPAAPAEVGHYAPGFTATGLEVSGSLVYLIEAGGLHVLDVSNPAAITELGSYTAPGHSSDIALVGHYTYIAHGDLLILDVANPAAISQAGVYPSPVNNIPDLQVDGDYAYLADSYSGLNIIRVTNPTVPDKAGRFNLPGGAGKIFKTGTRAFVIDGVGDLHIIDVINPSSPVQLGFYHPPSPINDIAVNGNYAYLGEDARGLSILNVTNPATPYETGMLPLPAGGYPYVASVAVAGPLVYYVNDSGFYAINVSNPAAPTQVGYLARGGDAVAVANGYAYVHDVTDLYIISVVNPAAPTQVGSFPTWGVMEIEPTTLAVNDHYVYVTAVYAGLFIVDVSDPTTPFEAGHYWPIGKALGVAATDDYIYATFGTDGLMILWLAPAASSAISQTGGTLHSPVDNTTYTFSPSPASSASLFTDTLIVTHTGRYSGRIPTHVGLVDVGHAFENTGIYSSTGQLAQPGPFTVTVEYDRAKLGTAIEDKLALYSWDGLRWIKEPRSVVDTTNHIVTATLDHFGLWAVLGETHRLSLPLIWKGE